jgi:hypothetical protein
MVWSLQSIQDIEDERLLAGHIALFLRDFDTAQVRGRKKGVYYYCKEVRHARNTIFS